MAAWEMASTQLAQRSDWWKALIGWDSEQQSGSGEAFVRVYQMLNKQRLEELSAEQLAAIPRAVEWIGEQCGERESRRELMKEMVGVALSGAKWERGVDQELVRGKREQYVKAILSHREMFGGYYMGLGSTRMQMEQEMARQVGTALAGWVEGGEWEGVEEFPEWMGVVGLKDLGDWGLGGSKEVYYARRGLAGKVMDGKPATAEVYEELGRLYRLAPEPGELEELDNWENMGFLRERVFRGFRHRFSARMTAILGMKDWTVLPFERREKLMRQKFLHELVRVLVGGGRTGGQFAADMRFADRNIELGMRADERYWLRMSAEEGERGEHATWMLASVRREREEYERGRETRKGEEHDWTGRLAVGKRTWHYTNLTGIMMLLEAEPRDYYVKKELASWLPVEAEMMTGGLTEEEVKKLARAKMEEWKVETLGKMVEVVGRIWEEALEGKLPEERTKPLEYAMIAIMARMKGRPGAREIYAKWKSGAGNEVEAGG